jgi:hypothetical protein
MVATVQIISCHGATIAAGDTNITSGVAKYKWGDDDTDDLVGKIPKPSVGSNYSYRKTMRIKVTVTPAGDISNLRWFQDGASWGTGIKQWVHSLPAANYTQGAVGDKTNKITQNGGSAVTDAAVAPYVTGTPLTVEADQILANPATGYGTSDVLESQIEVMSTASFGVKGPVVCTFRWDES